ncbi:MAG: A/G-specific adenine glycosylase [Candidatus Saccharibacteria bacterium]|nr:A/G-specific adenine glycosylase [Candidatus Saccharibacteria bacterium]
MSTLLRPQQREAFITEVTAYYQQHGRSMPWRENTDPYYVLVSEIMLQQTQVHRVRPKFEAFIGQFPTIMSLAQSPLSEVLRAWSGLGYNRRAKFLHQAAKEIVAMHDGRIPQDFGALTDLPGIGPNTAGAIMVYAFNQPVVFIETNVRSVFMHHFFSGKDRVADTELRPFIEQTIDHNNPREWYWALMDYGSYIKKRGLGKITASKHYAKQSQFEGSVRQLRGRILKQLTDTTLSYEELDVGLADERLPVVLRALVKEGLIAEKSGSYCLVD